MSEELRPCPFCGNEPVVEGNLVACNNLNCPTYDNYWTDPMIFTCDQWNTRPIEDALQSRIAELEAENDMLKQLSQPIEVWSDEKKQIYKINERRSVKSGSEECGDGT